ncbi:MAG: alpha/beta hydrolase [Rhodococcus sp. (in: high G+C Gram-positive bacteria)]
MPETRLRALRTVPDAEPRLHFRTIHGYRRAFRMAGEGPVVLLIHGIGDSSETWTDVLPHLASKYTVIAPDLLGHGLSDKPRADYSVAAYANGIRDLLVTLGIESVSVVGHSLGGGVAMQFGYQFPEMVERLVLVSAGGVTKDVHPALRLMATPVVNEAFKLLRLPGAMSLLGLAGSVIDKLDGTPFHPGAIVHDTPDLFRVLNNLLDSTAYDAYLRTLRAVVDWRGQVVTMLDRCYLTENLPVQLIWGDEDTVIPVGHAHLAHAAMPGSRMDVFHGAGHFPYRDDPMRFLDVLEGFFSTTMPLQFDEQRWRQMLVDGVGEDTIAGSATTRQAVLGAMGSDERSAT